MIQSQKVDSADGNKKPPSNSMFPRLNNTTSSLTHFPIWYKEVLSILATQEWNALYDSTTRDVVLSGTVAPTLNNHLYSSLLQCVKEDPRVVLF